jgi:hypothetical protein
MPTKVANIEQPLQRKPRKQKNEQPKSCTHNPTSLMNTGARTRPRKSFELVGEPLDGIDGIRARLSCTYIIVDATICIAIPAHFVEVEQDNLDRDTKP